MPRHYRSATHAFFDILRTEGLLHGLYKGVTSPMLGVALMNAVIFGAYGMCLQALSWQGSSSSSGVGAGPGGGSAPQGQPASPSLGHVFLAGCGSGVISASVDSRTQLSRTRVCGMTALLTSSRRLAQYHHLPDRPDQDPGADGLFSTESGPSGCAWDSFARWHLGSGSALHRPCLTMAQYLAHSNADLALGLLIYQLIYSRFP